MDKIDICGLKFSNLTFEEAINTAAGYLELPGKFIIYPSNVESIMLAAHDDDLKKICNNSSILLPDGMPVIWASRFLGTPLKEKISGPDFLPYYLEKIAKKGHSAFIVGGEEGVAARAAKNLSEKIKGLKIAGAICGYFEKTGEENRSVIEKINASGASVLIVAFGTPLQEKWIYENIKYLSVKVAVGVGSAVDYESDNKKRAPKWMCDNGLEWIYRLFREPRRLWERYLIRDIKFPALVLKKRYGKSQRNKES